MKFTAHVKTNKNGSECEFEVDDTELDGMTDEQREVYLHDQAMEAVFSEAQVQVWYEDAEQ